jgi:carbonic anhydrase
VNWLEWWTYDGISGPSFWGLINPEWALCNQVSERRVDDHIDRSLQGLRQSPIDLVPSELLYDPGLEEVFITPNKVQGKVFNTGHTATFKVYNERQEISFTVPNLLPWCYPVIIVRNFAG